MNWTLRYVLFPMTYSLLGYVSSFKNYRGGWGAPRTTSISYILQKCVINEINDIIKHQAHDLNIEFLNNINVVTLPSGHIDPDAYFDNLHLNNEKRVKKFSNNIKLKLGLNEQPIRSYF